MTESEWSEVETLRTTGDHTLAELAERFSVAVRTLQGRFERRGIEKDSAAVALAVEVRQKVLADNLGDPDDLAASAIDLRKRTVANARQVETLIMSAVEAAQKPDQAFRAGALLKALSLAASSLERLHDLQHAALGLDKSDMLGHTLGSIDPARLPCLTPR